MPRKVRSVCTITGQRKVAMERTWRKIKEMEAKGVPTIGKFGPTFREAFRETKKEGEEHVKKGTCFIDVEKGK